MRDLQARSVARAFAAPGWVKRFALHERSGLLAVSDFDADTTRKGYVALIDFETGRVAREIERPAHGIDGVARGERSARHGVIAPDGSRAVSHRGRGFLWNARGVVRRFDDQPRWIWDATFSPDDRFLLTASEVSVGSARNVLLLRDGRSGAPLAECVGHGSDVLAVAFSPNGRRAVSADRDGSLFLWTMPVG